MFLETGGSFSGLNVLHSTDSGTLGGSDWLVEYKGDALPYYIFFLLRLFVLVISGGFGMCV